MSLQDYVACSLMLQYNICYLRIIAERSEANYRDLWALESQLAFIYIYISVRHAFPASGGKPRVQNGGYMDAVFKFLAQKEAEIWTSLLRRFIK